MTIIELFTDFKFLSVLVSFTALLISIFVGVFNRKVTDRVTDKIQNNEIKHIEQDIVTLQKNDKEFKVDLKHDLNKIFRRLGKIEKNQTARNAVCDERHKKK